MAKLAEAYMVLSVLLSTPAVFPNNFPRSIVNCFYSFISELKSNQKVRSGVERNAGIDSGKLNLNSLSVFRSSVVALLRWPFQAEVEHKRGQYLTYAAEEMAVLCEASAFRCEFGVQSVRDFI